MDVYRLVLVGVEIEYESEVFGNLWHNRIRFIVRAANIRKFWNKIPLPSEKLAKRREKG